MSAMYTRDEFVLKIIRKYGIDTRPLERQLPHTSSSQIRISHGSRLYPVTERSRCIYCYLHNKINFSQRKCPDCLYSPALCQTNERDCHTSWHSSHFAVIRRLWYDKQEKKTTKQVTGMKRRGRPKGSINKKRRRGNYKQVNPLGTESPH